MNINDDRFNVPSEGIKKPKPKTYEHLSYLFKNTSDYGRCGEIDNYKELKEDDNQSVKNIRKENRKIENLEEVVDTDILEKFVISPDDMVKFLFKKKYQFFVCTDTIHKQRQIYVKTTEKDTVLVIMYIKDPSGINQWVFKSIYFTHAGEDGYNNCLSAIIRATVGDVAQFKNITQYSGDKLYYVRKE